MYFFFDFHYIYKNLSTGRSAWHILLSAVILFYYMDPFSYCKNFISSVKAKCTLEPTM